MNPTDLNSSFPFTAYILAFECELQQVTFERCCLFRTSLPKTTRGRSRLIVSPSCSFTCNRLRSSSSNVLGVKVLSFPTFSSTKMNFRLIISNPGGYHHKIGVLVSKRIISHQFWCCPCRMARKSFDFGCDFIAFVVTSTSGTSISVCFHRADR